MLTTIVTGRIWLGVRLVDMTHYSSTGRAISAESDHNEVMHLYCQGGVGHCGTGRGFP